MLIVASLIFSFVCVYLCASKVFVAIKKRRVANAFAKESGKSKFVMFAEYSERLLSGLTSRLLSFDFVSRFAEKLDILCSYYEIKVSTNAMVSSILAASLLVSLVVALVFKSPVLSISVFALCVMCAFFLVNNKIDKFKAEMREQIPEALRSMAACSRSGLSLVQTLEATSSECSGQLSKMFKSVSSKMSLGYSASDSLFAMKNSSDLRELKFIAVALDVQHTTGGSISPILESARSFVVSEIELARTLRVKTSQAKMSATIVTVMPFLLLALFSLISPEFLTPLFSTPIGIAIFFVAMTMQFAGVISIRKMLKKCGE